MITKETYRDSVITGSIIVKNLIQSLNLCKESTDHDTDMFEVIAMFFKTREALLSLLSDVADIDFGVEQPFEFSVIKYLNAASMFALDTPYAERYVELVYECLTTNTIPAELLEIEEQVPEDVRCLLMRDL